VRRDCFFKLISPDRALSETEIVRSSIFRGESRRMDIKTNLNPYDSKVKLVASIWRELGRSFVREIQIFDIFCRDLISGFGRFHSSVFRNFHPRYTVHITEIRPEPQLPVQNTPNSSSQPKAHHPDNTRTNRRRIPQLSTVALWSSS
jgi:hypothetical protein